MPKLQEQVPLAAVEQLANLQVRDADKLRRDMHDRRQAGEEDATRTASDEAQRKELLDNAIERLARLLAVAKRPSAWRCWELATSARLPPRAETNILRLSRKGKEISESLCHEPCKGEASPYHTLNWVAFRIFGPRELGRDVRELLDLVGRSERVIQEQPPAERSFWDKVAALATWPGNPHGEAPLGANDCTSSWSKASAGATRPRPCTPWRRH